MPSARLMAWHGLPDGWCRMCEHVWVQQIRWVSWQGTVHHAPLATSSAIPQGDPLGPLVCMLWTASGLEHVEGSLPPNTPQATTTLFMDDRNVTARHPEALLRRKNAWEDWSGSVGLIENRTKTAIVTTTAYRDHRIRNSALAPCLANLARVLGAYTARRRRAQTSDEIARLPQYTSAARSHTTPLSYLSQGRCYVCHTQSCLRVAWALTQ